MAKKQSGKANGMPLATVIRNSANQIWLAGLGALAHAEEKGGDWFENLIAAGENFERAAREQITRPIRVAERRVTETRDSIGESWSAIAIVIERRLAKILNSLQIPTSRDIAELTRRVEELQASLRALEAGKKAPRPTATRAAATRSKAKSKPTKKTSKTRTGRGRTRKTATRSTGKSTSRRQSRADA